MINLFKIENEIKRKYIPLFLRNVKEKNMFPFIMKNINKAIPQLSSVYFNSNKISDIFDVFDFEKEFFKNVNFNDVKPMGKSNSQCTSDNDATKYILYFILSDILDEFKLDKFNISKDRYIKDFINNEVN